MTLIERYQMFIVCLACALSVANFFTACPIGAKPNQATKEPSCRQINQPVELGKAKSTQKAVFRVGLGVVASITLSPEWNESEAGLNKQDCYFHKARKDWWDCRISFIVRAPYQWDVSITRSLKQILGEPNHQLSLNELTSLTKLLDPGVREEYLHYDKQYKNHELVGSTEHIDGQRVLIVTTKGKRSGPCEFLPDGSHRRPLLNYQSYVVYVLMSEDTVQEIICSADIMGNTKDDCLNETRKIIDTIKWSHPVSY